MWFFRYLLFPKSTDDKNFIPVDDRTMIFANALKPVQLTPTWSIVTRNRIQERYPSNNQSALTRCYGCITKETKYIENPFKKIINLQIMKWKVFKFSPLVGNDVKKLGLLMQWVFSATTTDNKRRTFKVSQWNKMVFGRWIRLIVEFFAIKTEKTILNW